MAHHSDSVSDQRAVPTRCSSLSSLLSSLVKPANSQDLLSFFSLFRDYSANSVTSPSDFQYGQRSVSHPTLPDDYLSSSDAKRIINLICDGAFYSSPSNKSITLEAPSSSATNQIVSSSKTTKSLFLEEELMPERTGRIRTSNETTHEAELVGRPSKSASAQEPGFRDSVAKKTERHIVWASSGSLESSSSEPTVCNMPHQPQDGARRDQLDGRARRPNTPTGARDGAAREPLPNDWEFIRGISYNCKYIASKVMGRPKDRGEILRMMRLIRAESKNGKSKKCKCTLWTGISGLRVTLNRRGPTSQRTRVGGVAGQQRARILIDDSIQHIYYVSHDNMQDPLILSYISKSPAVDPSLKIPVAYPIHAERTQGKFYCHVFKAKTKEQARKIVRGLERIFEICQQREEMGTAGEPTPDDSVLLHAARKQEKENLQQPGSTPKRVMILEDKYTADDDDPSKMNLNHTYQNLLEAKVFSHQKGVVNLKKPMRRPPFPDPGGISSSEDEGRGNSAADHLTHTVQIDVNEPKLTAHCDGTDRDEFVDGQIRQCETEEQPRPHDLTLNMQQAQIGFLWQQLEQQEQQILTAVAQTEVLKQQVAIEANKREDAEMRSHKLLLHNKDLLEHINKLVVENKELRDELKRNQELSSHHISHPALSSSQISGQHLEIPPVHNHADSEITSSDSGHPEISTTNSSASQHHVIDEWRKVRETSGPSPFVSRGDVTGASHQTPQTSQLERLTRSRLTSTPTVEEESQNNIEHGEKENLIKELSFTDMAVNSISAEDFPNLTTKSMNTSNQDTSNDDSANRHLLSATAASNGTEDDCNMETSIFNKTFKENSPVLPQGRRSYDPSLLLRDLMTSTSSISRRVRKSTDLSHMNLSRSVSDIYTKMKSIRRSLENCDHLVSQHRSQLTASCADLKEETESQYHSSDSLDSDPQQDIPDQDNRPAVNNSAEVGNGLEPKRGHRLIRNQSYKVATKSAYKPSRYPADIIRTPLVEDNSKPIQEELEIADEPVYAEIPPTPQEAQKLVVVEKKLNQKNPSALISATSKASMSTNKSKQKTPTRHLTTFKQSERITKKYMSESDISSWVQHANRHTHGLKTRITQSDAASRAVSHCTNNKNQISPEKFSPSPAKFKISKKPTNNTASSSTVKPLTTATVATKRKQVKSSGATSKSKPRLVSLQKDKKEPKAVRGPQRQSPAYSTYILHHPPGSGAISASTTAVKLNKSVKPNKSSVTAEEPARTTENGNKKMTSPPRKTIKVESVQPRSSARKIIPSGNTRSILSSLGDNRIVSNRPSRLYSSGELSQLRRDDQAANGMGGVDQRGDSSKEAINQKGDTDITENVDTGMSDDSLDEIHSRRHPKASHRSHRGKRCISKDSLI